MATAEMKMELKSPTVQLENSKESLISKKNQTEDRGSVLKEKRRDLEQINKKYFLKI